MYVMGVFSSVLCGTLEAFTARRRRAIERGVPKRILLPSGKTRFRSREHHPLLRNSQLSVIVGWSPDMAEEVPRPRRLAGHERLAFRRKSAATEAAGLGCKLESG
jgi:hypothetical protein